MEQLQLQNTYDPTQNGMSVVQASPFQALQFPIQGGQLQTQPQIIQLGQNGLGQSFMVQALPQGQAVQVQGQVPQTIQIQGQNGQIIQQLPIFGNQAVQGQTQGIPQQVFIQQPQTQNQMLSQFLSAQNGQILWQQPMSGVDNSAQSQLQTQGVYEVPFPSTPTSIIQDPNQAASPQQANTVPQTHIPTSTANTNGNVVMMVPGSTNTPTVQRVPLSCPEIVDDDEPLYVNAKQYHRILKRRQARAKLEAEGKILKERRKERRVRIDLTNQKSQTTPRLRGLSPSTHRHALNRARGEGGRFHSKNEDGMIIKTEPESPPFDLSSVYEVKTERLSPVPAEEFQMPGGCTLPPLEKN